MGAIGGYTPDSLAFGRYSKPSPINLTQFRDIVTVLLGSGKDKV
jgi:hypothetical protein